MGCSDVDPFSAPLPPQANSEVVSNAPAVVPGQRITKDMLIGDVVGQYPEAVDVMLKNGFHCIGCSVSPFESIGHGAMGHGFTEQQVDALIEEINLSVGNKPALSERPRAGVLLTSSAVEKISHLMEKEGKAGFGLRLAVVGGGCAGSSYEMDFDSGPKEDDEVFNSNGLKVFFHKNFHAQLGGIEIDYRDTLQSSGFVMRNPNAKSSCGCGSSFG